MDHPGHTATPANQRSWLLDELPPPVALDLPGVDLLHVHPGFLPDIRGADGVHRLRRGCFLVQQGRCLQTSNLLQFEH